MEDNITREKGRVTWLWISKIRVLLWDRNFLQLIIKALNRFKIEIENNWLNSWEKAIQEWFDLLQVKTLVAKYIEKLKTKEEISDAEKKYLISIFSNQSFLDAMMEEIQNDEDNRLRYNKFFNLWRNSTDSIKRDLVDLLSLSERKKFTDKHVFKISWSEQNIDISNWEIIETNWVKIRTNPEIIIDWKVISPRTIFEFIDWEYKWTQLFKPETVYKLVWRLWDAEELEKQIKKLYQYNIEEWLKDCKIPLYGNLKDLTKKWKTIISYNPNLDSKCNILCQSERSVEISEIKKWEFQLSVNNPDHPEFYYDLDPNEIFLVFIDNQ